MSDTHNPDGSVDVTVEMIAALVVGAAGLAVLGQASRDLRKRRLGRGIGLDASPPVLLVTMHNYPLPTPFGLLGGFGGVGPLGRVEVHPGRALFRLYAPLSWVLPDWSVAAEDLEHVEVVAKVVWEMVRLSWRDRSGEGAIEFRSPEPVEEVLRVFEETGFPTREERKRSPWIVVPGPGWYKIGLAVLLLALVLGSLGISPFGLAGWAVLFLVVSTYVWFRWLIYRGGGPPIRTDMIP